MASSSPVIVWFRQDLRLADNPALAGAAAGRGVIPLYILDETPEIRPLGGASRWWLDKSLRSLGAALGKAGSRLVLRRGLAAEVLQAVIRETGAGAVFWNRLYDPAAVARDTTLMAALKQQGLEVRSFNAALLNEPWEVSTGADGPYKVFTPYWRAARPRIDAAAPSHLPDALAPPNAWPEGESLDAWGLHPTAPDWSTGFTDWRPGESGASARLEQFIADALRDYPIGRDRLGRAGTSHLSPHLRFGEIGPRQILARLEFARAAGEAPDGAIEKFLAELGWREFNIQLLFHHPKLPTENLKREFDAFPWRDDPDGFDSWTRGRTGYPVVDAAMRELWITGTMHNRARMIVASFLVKDLMIDWRQGEAWFWDCLLDADLASNVFNWQWVAGSGADAQPFFRIFNPVSQGERFDADGAYVRRWAPELAGLPDGAIHAPWTVDATRLAAAGVTLGKDYPRPIVDHAAARERALSSYRIIRSQGD